MQNRRTKRATLTAVLLGAALVAVPFGTGSAAYAGVTAPVGNVGSFKQTFTENFSTAAASNGAFAKQYANSWQPYPDGTGGMYYAGSQVSARDGYMDVKLDGKHGAAGTFGTPSGAWSHVGGKFSVRAKATGGDGNGAAFMLWPTSNVWADGEIDYPEGNFESKPSFFQHSMTPGNEGSSTNASTGVSWRSWHVYSTEWIPGKSVTYLVDGKVIGKVTKDVPKTAHRFMFQVGNWGASGHLDIDWVSTYDYKG
ncbi:glycoside hydrolase family 16 protein [Curtobacterium sp. PhB115]|uniref:glycoside hydrolase family 16 protein n=1 Tax=Curtobacterium sp. PhB115 TaxID=2485173 RepID=UPI000F4C16CC|nr:glycoside hydrolase family 16 protein [Curtobacterium sp. PhB115]ROP74021.1 glycosyl hydrolase family 16 [Curtobacterium sp. PhB115]